MDYLPCELIDSEELMNNDLKSPKEVSRDNIDNQFKWKLSDLYESLVEWKNKKKHLEGEIEKISNFKGILTQSGKGLFEALDFYSNLEKEFEKIEEDVEECAMEVDRMIQLEID